MIGLLSEVPYDSFTGVHLVKSTADLIAPPVPAIHRMWSLFTLNRCLFNC
ncbi:hypothetical protein HHX47_DHR7000392, partial [Lentinula edodes]